MKKIFYNNNITNYAPSKIDSICPNYAEKHKINRIHGLPSMLFLNSLEGSAEIIIDNKTIILNEGDSVIIDSNYPYSYKSTQKKQWVTSFFSFSGELNSIIKKIMGFDSYLFLHADVDELNHTYINNWYTIFKEQYELINYIEISIELLKFFSDLKKIINKEILSDSYTYRTYIRPTRKFIHENYHEKILIGDLAKHVNISHQYLDKMYKEYLSVSPQQYLLDYRISVAKKMITHQTNLTVTEISMRCGFGNTSQFIQYFKMAVGTTPKKYRDLYSVNL